MAQHLAQRQHRLLARRELGQGSFVLRFERQQLHFVPGQYLIVGQRGTIHRREYSIYSSPQNDYLEILLKEIPSGLVSPLLHAMPIGEILEVEGPFGYFTIAEEAWKAHHLMISTGTGIAPFHSFVDTYPHLEYHIAHGVRTRSERYEYRHYPPNRYTACLSREGEGDYQGRVTDWLVAQSITADYYWLCGNSDMIYEVHDILMARNVDSAQIMAEVYF